MKNKDLVAVFIKNSDIEILSIVRFGFKLVLQREIPETKINIGFGKSQAVSGEECDNDDETDE